MAELLVPARPTDRARLMDLLGAYGNGGTSTSNGHSAPVAVDVRETEKEFLLSFDLPGMREEEISIELEQNVLTVSGTRLKQEQPGQCFHRIERHFGQFARSIGLPSEVRQADIQASYDAGVLEISVPKPEALKPTKIEIGKRAAVDGNGKRLVGKKGL